MQCSSYLLLWKSLTATSGVGGKAVGVRLAKRNSKQDSHEVIKAASAVISNASVWDTQKLLPGGAAPQKWRQESLATPMTGSFMHLHLGSTLPWAWPLVCPPCESTPKATPGLSGNAMKGRPPHTFTSVWRP